MTKLTIINVIGTLALAAVLANSQVSPMLAAEQDTAKVVKASFMFDQAGTSVTDAYLDLSQAERDRLAFRLADERSMHLLAIARAQQPTGPTDGR